MVNNLNDRETMKFTSSKLSIFYRFIFLNLPMLMIVAFVSFFEWKELNSNSDRLIQAEKLNNLALKSKIYVSEMSNAMRGYIINPSDNKEYEKKKISDENNSRTLQEMMDLAGDRTDLKELILKQKELDDHFLDPSENQVMDLIAKGKNKEAIDEFVNHYKGYREQYEELSSKTVKISEELSKKESQAVIDHMKQVSYQIALFLMGGVILTFVLVVYQTFYLTRKLVQLSSTLGERVEVISLQSSQLASASVQLSSNSVDSSVQIKETTQSMDELRELVEKNSKIAKEAFQLSQQGASSVKVAETEVKNLFQSMTEISESSKKIVEIINVIEDISFQTNLLALNAAVEAARAGEHGKGFAVVAEAVRSLAQRSAVAAKDTNQLIQESTRRTEQGVEMTHRTTSILKEVVSSVLKVSDYNEKISDHSIEQLNKIQNVFTGTQKLDSVTQENAAAAEEVAASANVMENDSKLLDGVMKELEFEVKGKVRDESLEGYREVA